MAQVKLRAARAEQGDERFLWLMLLEANAWRPGARKLSLGEAMADPSLASYVEAWGRDGDLGFIAETEGQPVGAAWWRLFNEDDHGYGFIEPTVPEVSIAVAEKMRGQGIGTALLRAIIEQASKQHVSVLSLSVERDNPALRLYERFGFRRVGQFENAWTMRRDIGSWSSR